VVAQPPPRRRFGESRKRCARVGRADDTVGSAGFVLVALGIGIEQLGGFAHEIAAEGDQAEAAAAFDIGVRQVEREQVELAAIDDHHLPVIAGKIVGGARHRDAGAEKAQLQLTQVFFAGAIGVRNQRVHGYAAADCVSQRPLDLVLIEPEDHDFDAAFGGCDALHQRQDTIAGLHYEFHDIVSRAASASTDTLATLLHPGVLQLSHRFTEGAVVKRRVQNHTWAILLIGGMLTAELADCSDEKSKNHEETTISGPGILWREPMDIASRKLYYGAG